MGSAMNFKTIQNEALHLPMAERTELAQSIAVTHHRVQRELSRKGKVIRRN
jgi:hypothetical protein